MAVDRKGRLLMLSLAVLAIIAGFCPGLDSTRSYATFPGVNGRIAFESNRDGNLEVYVMNDNGHGQINVTNHPAADRSPSWSPSGTKIAFVSDRAGQAEIYTMNADGTGVQQITDGGLFPTDPAWSPDGSEIVFAGTEGINLDLYITSADGSNLRQLTDDPEADQQPDWSPDGEMIAFGRSSAIYAIGADGKGLSELIDDEPFEGSPSWSPDGAQIAFMSDRVGPRCGHPDCNFDVFTLHLSSHEVTRVTEDQGVDGSPVWSPDGRSIAFSTSRHDTEIPGCAVMTCDFEIYVIDVETAVEGRLEGSQYFDRASAWQPILAGDASCSHGVNAVDAALLLQFDAGLLLILPCPEFADVNSDGAVNALDAALVLQYIAGFLPTLPP